MDARSIEKSIQEQKEKEPKISYHFFYSAHRTAEDFKNLEKAFDKADIYVPEIYAWTPKVKFIRNKVSQGEITPEQISKEYNIEKLSSRYRDLDIIYNSHKPILLADIPGDDKEFMAKTNACEQLYKRALSFFIQGRLQDSIQTLRSCVINSARVDLIREKRIRKSLEEQIKTFLRQNPEYAAKKELKVLIRLGALHTTIYHKLKRDKILSSREFSHFPPVFDSYSESIRKIMFKKEVDDELLARAIIEEYLFAWLKTVTDDSNKALKIIREISSKLTLKNIEQISKNIAEVSEEPRTPSFLGFPIEDIVYETRELGIKVPDSEEEMDELLKQPSK